MYLKHRLSDTDASIVDQDGGLAMRLLDLLAEFHDGRRVGDIALVEMHTGHCNDISTWQTHSPVKVHNSHLASSGGKSAISKAMTRATFEKPFTIS